MLRKEIEFIFICEHSFPDGGAQSTRINNIVKGVANLVASVTVLPKTYVNDDNIQWNECVTVSRHCVSHSPSSQKKSFIKTISDKLFLVKVFHALIKHNCVRGSTLVYISSASPLILLGVFLICRIKRYKILTDLGEWFPAPTTLVSFISYSYFRHVIFRWIATIISDYIVAISSFIKMKCIFSSAAVVVIPSIAPYPDSATNISVNRTGNLFYPGTLKKEDGIENLLLALYKLSRDNYNINLVTCGSFSEASFRECCTLAGVPLSFATERIEHLGWLSNAAYLDLLQRSSLVVLPRPLAHAANIASFPTRLAEAMSFATPVAIANVGDVGIYLRSNQDYLDLGSGTSDAIYSVLRSWLDNSFNYDNIGLNGYLNSRIHFDANINAARLIEFIYN